MGRRYQVPKQQLDGISAGQKEVVRSEGGLYPVDQRWLMTMADDDGWRRWLMTMADDDGWRPWLTTMADDDGWWRCLMTMADDRWNSGSLLGTPTSYIFWYILFISFSGALNTNEDIFWRSLISLILCHDDHVRTEACYVSSRILTAYHKLLQSG